MAHIVVYCYTTDRLSSRDGNVCVRAVRVRVCVLLVWVQCEWCVKRNNVNCAVFISWSHLSPSFPASFSSSSASVTEAAPAASVSVSWRLAGWLARRCARWRSMMVRVGWWFVTKTRRTSSDPHPSGSHRDTFAQRRRNINIHLTGICQSRRPHKDASPPTSDVGEPLRAVNTQRHVDCDVWDTRHVTSSSDQSNLRAPCFYTTPLLTKTRSLIWPSAA